MNASPDAGLADAAVRVVAAIVLDGLPVGVVALLATAGGACVARRLCGEVPRSLLAATGFGLAVAWMITAGLLLGLAGSLSAATAAGVALLPAAGLALAGRDAKQFWRLPAWSNDAWFWLGPIVLLCPALVAASLPPGELWGGEPNAYDVLSYHLQVPREWHDVGRIVPLEHNVFSRMPLGNEVLFLLAMHLKGGPGEATLAVHFVNVALAVGMVAAVYAAARGAGGTSLQAIVAASVAAAVPWVPMLASVAYNEPLYLLAAALATAWLLRAAAGDVRAAVWAGLFAGLGVTAKYTAVPMLVVAGGVALVVVLLRVRPEPELPLQRPGLRKVAMVLGGFSVASLALPLPWLVRNTIWYGFPTSPLVGGTPGWSAQQVGRFAAAHDQPLANAPAAVWHEVLANGRFGYALWPLGVAAIMMLLLRPATRRRGLLLATAVAVMLVVWATATHQVGRFLVVAIPPLAVAAGLAFRHRGWLVAVFVAATMPGYFYVVEWHDPMPGREDAPRGLIEILKLRSPLLGVTGLPTYLTPFDRDPSVPVHLVGDAMAFAYAGEVHYKVVFDVPPADDAVRAWLGESLDAAPASDLVVINANEVARLRRTYGTPPLPPEVPGSGVMTMGELRSLLSAAP